MRLRLPGPETLLRPCLGGLPGLIVIREAADMDLVRELFREYMAAVDAPVCFASFDTESPACRRPTSLFSSRRSMAQPPAVWPSRRLSDTAEMKRLYMRPAFRGLGLGEKLFARPSLRPQVGQAASARHTAVHVLRHRPLPPPRLYSNPRYHDIPDPGALFFELSLEPHRTVD